LQGKRKKGEVRCEMGLKNDGVAVESWAGEELRQSGGGIALLVTNWEKSMARGGRRVKEICPRGK
jgi:hypothetical protein